MAKHIIKLKKKKTKKIVLLALILLSFGSLETISDFGQAIHFLPISIQFLPQNCIM